MFAIVKIGGSQYHVKEGDKLEVQRLAVDAGSNTTFNEVLAVNGKVGAPVVAGASVVAEVLEHFKDDKVLIFKKKRRHNYRRLNGHRQPLTLLKITSINAA